MVWPRARPRALLVLILLVAPLLAGCLGDDSEPADQAPIKAAPLGAPDPATLTLPQVRLEAALNGTRLDLAIHLDGDTGNVAGWRLTPGDGARIVRDGKPPATFAYTYAPLRDHRLPPTMRHLTLAVVNAYGQESDATTNITIQPPPNRPAYGDLSPDVRRGEAPLLVTFTMSARDEDGTIRSWTFDAGDGSATKQGSDAPKAPLVHEYRAIGTHNATLTLTDDSGDTSQITQTIRVVAPQDVRVWTYDTKTRLVALHDGNGTILRTLNTTHHGCGANCGRPVGIVATSAHTFVLIDRNHGNGTLWQLDGTTGRSITNHTLAPRPETIVVDDREHIWIAHRLDGTLVHLAPDASAPDHISLPLSNGSKQIAHTDDGTSLLVLERGDTSRIVRLDTTTLRPDTLPLILPDAAHVAQSTKHRTVVAAHADGRITLATPTLYGPTPAATFRPGDAAPTDIICPRGHDLCYAAYAADASANTTARVVAFGAKADITDTLLPTWETVDLRDHAPASLSVADRMLVVATYNDTANGFALIPLDGGNATFVEAGHAPRAPHAPVMHARQDRLVYHIGASGTWATLDVTDKTIAISATQAQPDADGLTLSYLKRTLAR